MIRVACMMPLVTISVSSIGGYAIRHLKVIHLNSIYYGLFTGFAKGSLWKDGLDAFCPG